MFGFKFQRSAPLNRGQRARLGVESLEDRTTPDAGSPGLPPLLVDIGYDVAVGQNLVASEGVGLLANYELDGFGSLTINSLKLPGGTTTYNPGVAITTTGGGTLTVTSDGSFSYVPGQGGPDVVEFYFSDGISSGYGTATLGMRNSVWHLA